MSRVQVDLIDFQSLPDGEYKYILTYVNHFSKFCELRPLTSKRATEVAVNLLDIFLIFGAPAILHTDNGREFSNSVISEMKTMWPQLKLVTGRPRHLQSQGAVERLNGVVKEKLTIWMRENNSKRWSIGIKFVRWQINISMHETIRQTPYEVTFGISPPHGLDSYFLPKSLLDQATTESDIIDFLARSDRTNTITAVDNGKNACRCSIKSILVFKEMNQSHQNKVWPETTLTTTMLRMGHRLQNVQERSLKLVSLLLMAKEKLRLQ